MSLWCMFAFLIADTAHSQCLLGDPDEYIKGLEARPLTFAKRIQEAKQLQHSKGISTLTSLQLSIPVLAGKYTDTGADPFSPAELDSVLFINNRNVTDYYNEVSYGNLQLTGTVYGHAAGGLAVVDTTEAGYLGNPQQYVIDLVAAVDSVVDFSQYDSDNDGYVDWVAAVFPTRDNACLSGYHLTSLFSRLTTPYLTNDGVQISDFRNTLAQEVHYCLCTKSCHSGPDHAMANS
jgi:hypothetical protein